MYAESAIAGVLPSCLETTVGTASRGALSRNVLSVCGACVHIGDLSDPKASSRRAACAEFAPAQRWRGGGARTCGRSEEHTSELQSLMRISYAVFCLKKKKSTNTSIINSDQTHIH